ncbi:MAG TPA: hypothetical protein VFB31_09575 [Pseudolabrys sp.]|nr:hypothetical protein [Pseudolabrys sp.]
MVLLFAGEASAFHVHVHTFECSENCVAQTVGFSVLGTVLAFVMSGYPLRWYLKQRAQKILQNNPLADISELQQFYSLAPLASIAIVFILGFMLFFIATLIAS